MRGVTGSEARTQDPGAAPALAAYGFAVLAALGAVALDLLLREHLADAPVDAVLLGAVMLAVAFGGPLPGLLCIGIGWGLALLLLVELPAGRVALEGELGRWLVALAVALGVVLLTAVLRRRRHEAQVAAKEAEETTLQMAALRDVAAAVSRALTTAEVVHALMGRSPAALGAQGAAVALVEGDELVVHEPMGVAAVRHQGGMRVPLDAPRLIAEAVREGSVLRADDRGALERAFPETAASMPSVEAAIACPIRVAGSVVGAAGYVFEQAGAVGEDVEAMAVIVADLAGQALERARLYEREREARLALDRILAVAPRFHAESAGEVTAAICREARASFGSDYGVLWRLRGDELELLAIDPEAADARPGLVIPLDDFPLLGRAARELRVSFVPDVQRSSSGKGRELVRRLGVHSSFRTPITISGRTEFVLVVSWRSVVPEPDATTVLVARRFADQAGLALEQLERRRAEAEAARRGEEARRLHAVTSALSLAATAADVSTACLEHALESVGADAGFVVLAGSRGAAAEIVASSGLGEDELERWGSYGPEADVPFTRALGSGEPVWALTPQEMAAFAVEGEQRDQGWVSLPLKTPAGVRGALHLSFRSPRALDEDERRWLQAIVSQCAQALERSRLFDEEQRLRRQSERMQEMAVALSTALTRADVADIAVEQIGGAVAADGVVLGVVLEERGVLSALAWRGYPEELVEGWIERPLDADAPGPRVLRRRRSLYFPSPEELARAFPEAARAAAPLGHGSFFLVPLFAGGLGKGLLLLSWEVPGALLDDDRRFVEALAGHAAQALDRAAHYESEQTIAETLQRSILPVTLPRVEGVQLAARYLPGSVEMSVGGDWFDAMQLPDGRLGLVVGDVVGKGVHAAATMGQLRNALRAFTLERLKPSSTLARLDKLAEQLLETTFGTIVFAVLEPRTRVCRFTCAGHPPPLVAYPDGRVELLEGGRGLPLGAGANGKYPQRAITLPVGSMLLLYSDGLVERRGESIDVGLARLLDAVREGPRDPERLLEHVLERVVEDRRGDDAVLLAARLLAVAPEPFSLRLARDVRSLELARDALRVWLQGAGGQGQEAHDVVLAAWEACANALEHAAAPAEPAIELRAELEAGVVRVSIEDAGRWAPGKPRQHRGLGLRLMRSLAAVDVSATESGTRVTIEKALTPPPEAIR
ncbi:MAG TPA: SpoIIE family protein phosphatase [Gaiellaceae bacterium]|nr:SpoIIE family protein phosphatase [Gaiellaceae bacterium]